MSFSKFNIADYNLISKEWKALEVSARLRCRTPEEFAVVQKAFEFANTAHRHVRRRSGEPYMIHPIQVARIVVEDIGLGYKSISAALLHDVVEDTSYTVDDVKNLFGERIALLVNGLTKIKNLLDNEDRRGGTNIESIQAENLKRILLTLNDDVRVVLIKLADRLHNCRTIEFMPEHKRDKILSETMFIFIPLAHRLGLYSIKSEMENIWLKYKEPDSYREISERIRGNVALRDAEIDEFIAPIEGALKQSDISFIIKKRIKTPYSIWFKMRTKNVPFEQIYDLYAVRIIYNTGMGSPDAERQEAFHIYAILMGLYRSQQSRLRDWISSPKNNGYEALHCTLMSHAGIWIEVQIRSRRMDDIAEKGIAAHWAYKNDGYISENDSSMDQWLAKVKEILASPDMNSLELLDIIHKDLITTDIVVFTPKGEQRSIQAGATALDFAYSIHTRIGASAIAAKVNMRLVPLSQVLRSGDQVEIITADSAHPKQEWLSFLQTRHARNKVIDYFKADRRSFIDKGADIYYQKLAAAGVKPDKAIARRFIEAAQINDQDELFFRIGLSLVGDDVFDKVLSRSEPAILEGGTYVIADCCHPIPGDPVVGFRAEDGTITVHKKTCPMAESLASKHGNKVVTVPGWNSEPYDFTVRVDIKGIDRQGLLNDITNYISRTMGMNMTRVQLGSKDGVVEGFFSLQVRSRKNLEAMLEGLRKVPGIQEVVRKDM